jgi:hypothetical protein
MVRPVDADQLSRMLDPEDVFAIRFPSAFDVLTSLKEAGINVREIRRIQHAHQFRVIGGVVVCVYTSGKVVVQGDVFQGGATGKLLKRALPKDTIWQH